MSKNSLEIPHILLEISTFLPFKDLINMMSVSSHCYQTICQFFSNFLRKNQSDFQIPSFNLKSHLLFAQYFCKKIQRFSIRPNHFSLKTFDSNSETRFLNKSLKSFLEIKRFSCFLHADNRLVVEEDTGDRDTISTVQKYIVEGVEKMQATRKHLVLMREQDFAMISLEERPLTTKLLNLPAEDIGNTEILDFSLNEKQMMILAREKEKKQSLEALLIQIEDFDSSDDSYQIPIRKCVFPGEVKEILSWSMTETTAYFVGQNNVLYEVDLTKRIGKTFSIETCQTFKERAIIKVFTGPNQTFVIEKLEKKAFCQYSNAEVLEMLEKSKGNFSEYFKIFKYSKVTGKELNNCSDCYLLNNFGLKNHGLKEILRNEIKKRQASSQEHFLWFFGDNSKKQFCFPKAQNKTMVAKPELLNVPLNPGKIEKIIAFKDITYIFGGKGEIVCSVPSDFVGVTKEKWMVIRPASVKPIENLR